MEVTNVVKSIGGMRGPAWVGPTRLVVSAIDASTDLAGNAAGGAS